MIIGPYQVAARWLRRHAFRAFEARSIRASASLLLHDSATHRPPSLNGPGPAIVPFLESFARRSGWTVEQDDAGASRACAAQGGCVRILPGGQLEYASRAHDTPRALHADLEQTLRALGTHAAECGLTPVAAGIDPLNDLDAAPLLLQSEHYTRKAAYFAAIGRAGARMMRQSAGLEIGVGTAAPLTAFTALNAAAPALVAGFANSTRYAGDDSGSASCRSEDRLRSDPARTGLLPDGPPHERYAEFALAAPAMMLPHTFNALPFIEHWRLGTSAAQWREHLGTLFPEVRPNGYLEVRSVDAQPPGALALPILMVSAIAWDVPLQGQVRRLIGPADPALLARAARSGLRDAALASMFTSLVDMTLDAARRIGVGLYGDVLERARDEASVRMSHAAGEVRT